MSQQERDWLDWLKRAQGGTVTQKFAAEKMGITERWVRALLAEMRVKGDAAVVHGLRGRPSNRRIGEETRARAMEIVKSPDWHDFRPTFAAEQLANKETVRQWMMAEGIWQSRGRKLQEMHRWRPRRSHHGELVQWETSDRDWLEGRGEPVCHLVRMIDDATSRSWGGVLCGATGRGRTLGVLWEYVERFGRPVDDYTNATRSSRCRRGQGRIRRNSARLTQIGRALGELGIGWIAAYSAQAKGARGTGFSHRSGPADQGVAAGQGGDPVRGQRVFGEGVLAGMEREVHAAGAGPGRPAPAAGGGF